MAEKQATLLVAETGSELAAALAPCLGEKGCKVKSVNNLKDVLIALQSEAIRVLVLDACLARDMGYDSISPACTQRRRYLRAASAWLLPHPR